MGGTSIASRILLRERNEQSSNKDTGKQKIIGFESYSKLSESLGLGKVKSFVKPGAVPSIFEKPASFIKEKHLVNITTTSEQDLNIVVCVMHPSSQADQPWPTVSIITLVCGLVLSMKDMLYERGGRIDANLSVVIATMYNIVDREYQKFFFYTRIEQGTANIFVYCHLFHPHENILA